MTARTAEVAVFAGVRGPARTFSYLVPDISFASDWASVRSRVS
jgi:hypothetical protein